jgi:hypothetical protein
VLDSPVYMRTPRTLTRHWTARDEDGTPIAHRCLEIASALLSSSLPAWSPAPCLSWLRAVTDKHGLDWSSATWPTLIRPHSPSGRALGAGSVEAGLLLIQRASDPGGSTVVVFETTMRARRASPPLLESFSIPGRSSFLDRWQG